VLNVYMEEPPLVADWKKLTSAPNVVVVPFFISDGLHSYEDIPMLLGIADEGQSSIIAGGKRREIFRRNPYQLNGRSLFYSGAIGADARFADIILAQTQNFGSKS